MVFPCSNQNFVDNISHWVGSSFRSHKFQSNQPMPQPYSSPIGFRSDILSKKFIRRCLLVHLDRETQNRTTPSLRCFIIILNIYIYTYMFNSNKRNIKVVNNRIKLNRIRNIRRNRISNNIQSRYRARTFKYRRQQVWLMRQTYKTLKLKEQVTNNRIEEILLDGIETNIPLQWRASTILMFHITAWLYLLMFQFYFS